jgi:hypothetical protein
MADINFGQCKSTDAGLLYVIDGVVVNQSTGVTSGQPVAFYSIKANSSITAYPTAAGTAIVKVSTSPIADCAADVVAKNFSNGTAKWQDWTSGSVTAVKSEKVNSTISAAVIVVTSGTWNLEVCS